jgi:uncharacterized protein YciI
VSEHGEPARDAGRQGEPRERDLAVLSYATVPEQAGRLQEIYPRHRAYLAEFAASGDLLLIGTFEDPVVNGSQAVFSSADAAKRFAGRDPFVLEGLVRPTVLAWSALDFQAGGAR